MNIWVLMKKREINNNNHGGEKDRYLITYADLITLLLGLFVILYASSQVDSEKYKEVSSAFTKYFRSEPANVLSGGEGMLDGNRGAIPEPMLLPREAKSLDEIQKETEEALSTFITKGMLSLKKTDAGIVVVMPEKLLFSSGKAEIQTDGLKAIDSLSKVLQSMRYMIMVDGHTDSSPIKTFQFESNWHLSVARALNVGYRMIRSGVPEENFVIRGFGDKRPVADNISTEGKMQNRRVEIIISQIKSDAPASVN